LLFILSDSSSNEILAKLLQIHFNLVRFESALVHVTPGVHSTHLIFGIIQSFYDKLLVVLREEQVAFNDAMTICLAALTKCKPVLAFEHQIVLQCAEVFLFLQIQSNLRLPTAIPIIVCIRYIIKRELLKEMK